MPPAREKPTNKPVPHDSCPPELSKITQEFTGRNIDRLGDAQQRLNGDDLFAALDFADVFPVQIDQFGQGLLGKPRRLPVATNRRTDPLPMR